jgi:uncharacterized protein (DUF2147 family)
MSISTNAQPDTIFGTWKTFDEETGDEKSIVEVYEQQGRLYVKVLKTFPKPGEDPDPVCDQCKGELKDKKIHGMVIVNGLTEKEGVWCGGEILDPENGKTYDCKMWLEDGNLQVRGYLLFFFRTQTWIRHVE